MTFEQIADMVKVVGFPIGVALWFMFRTDKKIEDNTKALQELTLAIKTLGGHQ